MIDFTGMTIKNKTYAGANGSKLAILYNGAMYMLKFPARANRNKDLSYANNCVSEDIGCRIFAIAGIPVQETILGTYRVRGEEKIVVACRDFTTPGITLQDFASLKNTIIDSGHNGYGTELGSILQAIEEQQALDPGLLKERFWDMFIVDALIGNWDRHNGNWGFLYDAQTDAMRLAPVFDCGSSLYPQADENMMLKILSNKNELNSKVFEMPTSSIQQNRKRINYFRFISSLEDEGCNAALRRIVPLLDMERIRQAVYATPYISDVQKEFYTRMMAERKEKILDHSLMRLLEREPCFPARNAKARAKKRGYRKER